MDWDLFQCNNVLCSKPKKEGQNLIIFFLASYRIISSCTNLPVHVIVGYFHGLDSFVFFTMIIAERNAKVTRSTFLQKQ